MEVKRLVVGKGRTSRPRADSEEWLREYYEVAVVIEDPGELEVAKANLTGLIDGWLSASKPAVKAAIENPMEVLRKYARDSEMSDQDFAVWMSDFEKKQAPQLPQLDPDELAKLPWKNYKTKEAAGPDEAAWVFANTKEAEALLALLKTKDKAQVGSFEYSRSGSEKQFISRKPLKPKI